MSSNSSTNLKVIEAVRGTFTGTNGDLVIDGIGGFTLDGVAGTYVVVEGTHQLTVKTNSDVTAYYEVTITGTTYTLVQPMVTVSYNSVVTKASEQVNKNTKFAPANMENTDELIFLGWYSDSEYKTKFTSVSKITADLELFAKWAEKVVLTYVVGNDYEQVTEDYYAGQTLTIKSFAMKNDLKITGWYEEATYDTLFTATTLTANKTIYAKWETAPAYEITTYGYSTSFKWKENDGTWSAGNAANNSSSSSLVITAKKAGTLTFDYYVKSESDSKWDYMGIYKGVFEAKSTSMPSGLLKNAGGSTGVSGNYSITLAAGESVSIVFVRDSSGGPSDTTCQISNIGFVVA